MSSGFRQRATWVLCLALFGGAHLYAAADKVTSVSVTDGQITIELAGKPTVTTDSYGRDGSYVFVVSLKDSVLVGRPQHLKAPGDQAATIDVSQFTLNPDVVHVVIRSPSRVSFPVRISSAGGGRYEVALALRTKPRLKVFLDVGHGGYDPGGTGPDGLPESFVNLSVAKRLSQILQQNGIEVELDRSNNQFVSLAKRVALADKSSANLFLGLYCNASSDRSIHGTTTYYYHQNSYAFARYLQDHVASALGLANNGVMKDNLYVIRHTTTTIPDVLIEYAYISNYHEERLLGSPSFRDRIANALADAVMGYFVHSAGEKQPTASQQENKSTGPSGAAAAHSFKQDVVGPATVTTIETTNGTVRIDSSGVPAVESFTMQQGGATYFVVNLKNTVLSGRGRSFSVGPPFSGRVTVDQFSVNPNVVRVAVREDYQNSYQIEKTTSPGNQAVTTIYPMSN